jgi:hypothetical protein
MKGAETNSDKNIVNPTPIRLLPNNERRDKAALLPRWVFFTAVPI